MGLSFYSEKAVNNTAFDGLRWNFSQKRFKLRDFTCLSRTIGLTNTPEMTSLAASGRLQNATKYHTKCAKWVRPDKESNNSTTVLPIITKACIDIHADIVFSHAGFDITSCFRSAFVEVRKTAENAASDCFVCIKSNAVSKASSNFSSEEYQQRFRTKWCGVSSSPENYPAWKLNALPTNQKTGLRVYKKLSKIHKNSYVKIAILSSILSLDASCFWSFLFIYFQLEFMWLWQEMAKYVV